jgi:hypothetical protein
LLVDSIPNEHLGDLYEFLKYLAIYESRQFPQFLELRLQNGAIYRRLTELLSDSYLSRRIAALQVLRVVLSQEKLQILLGVRIPQFCKEDPLLFSELPTEVIYTSGVIEQILKDGHAWSRWALLEHPFGGDHPDIRLEILNALKTDIRPEIATEAHLQARDPSYRPGIGRTLTERVFAAMRGISMMLDRHKVPPLQLLELLDPYVMRMVASQDAEGKRNKNSTCFCCGYCTLKYGCWAFEECVLCGWINNPMQSAFPKSTYGPNTRSLAEAQLLFNENYPTTESRLSRLEELRQLGLIELKLEKDSAWRTLAQVDLDRDEETDCLPSWQAVAAREASMLYWQKSQR